MKALGCRSCVQIQGDPFFCHNMQIRSPFEEEIGVPFIVGLPSEDVDSAEQMVFMVPGIKDPSYNSNPDNGPVLLIESSLR
jgi:hypothetical protein